MSHCNVEHRPRCGRPIERDPDEGASDPCCDEPHRTFRERRWRTSRCR